MQHGVLEAHRPANRSKFQQPANEQRLSDAEPELIEGTAVHGVG
jgi:hypothetical protein